MNLRRLNFIAALCLAMLPACGVSNIIATPAHLAVSSRSPSSTATVLIDKFDVPARRVCAALQGHRSFCVDDLYQSMGSGLTRTLGNSFRPSKGQTDSDYLVDFQVTEFEQVPSVQDPKGVTLHLRWTFELKRRSGEVVLQLNERAKGPKDVFRAEEGGAAVTALLEEVFRRIDAELARQNPSDPTATEKPSQVASGAGSKADERPAAKSSTTAWPNVVAPLRSASEGGADSALVIAIENYAFLSAVPGAIKNGRDWYTYLTQLRKVPPTNVRFLMNAEATDFAITSAAEEVAKLAGPGGKTWLVFIGHGAPNQGATDGLLVAADAQQTVAGLENRSVPQGKLLNILAKGQGTPVAVIDACYSGKRGDGQALVAGLQPSAVVRTSVPQGAIVMTAGGANEYAGPLPGEERPGFSYLALGALRGWGDTNGDGRVTAEEVVDYSKVMLRALLSGNRMQTPELAGGSQATVLGAGTEKGPDLGELLLKLKSQH